MWRLCLILETIACDFELIFGPEYGVAAAALSASSSFSSYGTEESMLNGQRAWAADTILSDDDEWIQVDLGTVRNIQAVLTQGQGNSAVSGTEYVSSYKLSVSVNGNSWSYVINEASSSLIFQGNTNTYTVRRNDLPDGTTARFVKLYVQQYVTWPSLRWEILGCP